jgi:hypothetical protein
VPRTLELLLYLLAKTATESLDLTASVDQPLLTREERVALRAKIDLQVRLG